MFNFHKNHFRLLITIFLVFFGLSVFIAVVPAYKIQKGNAPLPSAEPMTEEEIAGLSVFISEGCVACHTQQVRNIEMDKMWGGRPSIPSDYYYSKQRMDVWRQSPSLLGSERTGPDLTSVGQRQPSDQWHLIHLYNPRIVVKESVMPAYPWLFIHEENPDENTMVIEVPDEYRRGTGQIIPTDKAIQLVAYLKSLKQSPIVEEAFFIPARERRAESSESSGTEELLDGSVLYQNNCVACHQANGQGLPGAFPPLDGSKILTEEDPGIPIQIVLQGYDARPEYAQMPEFSWLSNEEIAAILSHVRSSWSNNSPSLNAGDVEEIREKIGE